MLLRKKVPPEQHNFPGTHPHPRAIVRPNQHWFLKGVVANYLESYKALLQFKAELLEGKKSE